MQRFIWSRFKIWLIGDVYKFWINVLPDKLNFIYFMEILCQYVYITYIEPLWWRGGQVITYPYNLTLENFSLWVWRMHFLAIQHAKFVTSNRHRDPFRFNISWYSLRNEDSSGATNISFTIRYIFFLLKILKQSFTSIIV